MRELIGLAMGVALCLVGAGQVGGQEDMRPLGLKSTGMGPLCQDAFFQANETAGRPEEIRLGPHSDDGSFTELAPEWKTANFRPDGTNVLLVPSATENNQQ